MTWSNRPGPRDRRAWCLLITDDVVHRFAGDDIPGVVAVVGRDYEKAGKWSHDTFRLALAPGVRLISGHEGWETGTFAEGLASATRHTHCDTWLEIATALGVSLPSAQTFLRAWRPKAAEALDLVEARLAEIDEIVEAGVSEITLNLGGPTRRMREAGYWSWPVVVTGHDGAELGRITPGSGGWGDPDVAGSIRLIASTETSGHGGGYVSLRIAAPEGATAKHGGQTCTS